MKTIVYYLALVFIYILVILPFPILYLISDFIFVLLYYIIGYRKRVVAENLKNAFPDKSKEELEIIAKKFYIYLCDLFLETLKTLVMPKKTALRHCYLNKEALDLFNKYEKEGKSVIIVMGHLGNWEWAGNAFSIQCKQQLYVIYHPLSNKHFNHLMHKMRTRFGTRLYAMKDAFKEMVNNKEAVTATAFIADQTPPPEGAYWTSFLNQNTPVFWGTEKIARKLNYSVVYVSVWKKKRGCYEVRAETLVENAKDTKPGEISEAHTKRLEADILKCPENWLWSHRRWKHKQVK